MEEKKMRFVVGLHLGRGLDTSALAVVQGIEEEETIRCLAARTLPPEYTALEVADELAAVEEKLQAHDPEEIVFLTDCRPPEREELLRKLAGGKSPWGSKDEREVICCYLTTEAEESLDYGNDTWKINGEDIKIKLGLLFGSKRLILPESYQSPDQQREMDEMFEQVKTYNPAPRRRKAPDTVAMIGNLDHLATALALACYGASNWRWPAHASIIWA